MSSVKEVFTPEDVISEITEGGFDIVAIEGLHLSGKSYLLEILKKELGVFVYSSMESVGGRKKFMNSSGSMEAIEVGNAFYFALDFIDQRKKKSGMPFGRVVFDRTALSNCYYRPSSFSSFWFREFLRPHRVLWVLCDPDVSSEGFRSVVNNAVNEDTRVTSLEEYIKSARSYRDIMIDKLDDAGQIENLVVYKNSYSDEK